MLFGVDEQSSTRVIKKNLYQAQLLRKMTIRIKEAYYINFLTLVVPFYILEIFSLIKMSSLGH